MLLVDRGAAEGVVRLVATLFQWGWPVNIALIPISLLFLPDGRLPSPRWRPAATALVVNGTAVGGSRSGWVRGARRFACVCTGPWSQDTYDSLHLAVDAQRAALGAVDL